MNSKTIQDLHDYYDKIREAQARIFNKPLSEFSNNVAQTVFRASILAINDVQQSNINCAFKVVNAPTGSGKTINSIAMVIAAERFDFSSAIICDTIRTCNEIYEAIIKLKGNTDNVIIWTEAHDATNPKEDEWVNEKHGFTPIKRYYESELKDSMIIVCTKNKWRNEMKRDIDKGIRKYKGNSRHLKFIDEHPDLVELTILRRSDILKLGEEIESVNSTHPLVQAFYNITSIMEDVTKANSASYFSTPVVDHDDYNVINDYREDIVIEELCNNKHSKITKSEVNNVFNFISASANGCSFYSNQHPKGFIAYQLLFKKEPGYILLDATADITGMTTIVDGMENVDTTAVDFSRLKIKNIVIPKRFRNFAYLFNKGQKEVKEYISLIKDYVLSSTYEYDHILLVVHKDLADHYLGHFSDPDNPTIWEGRKLNIIYWGNFIGSNKFKACNHVFLFGEYYLPRYAIIATTNGLKEIPISNQELRNAYGQKLINDYKLIEEGHLLRQFKQLASRGSLRNISSDGICGEMTLHTTMDSVRLQRSLNRLFAGCNDVELITKYSDPSDRKTKSGVLIDLLRKSDTDKYSFSELRNKISISKNHLPDLLKDETVSLLIKRLGWEIRFAKDLGLSGRNKYLVKV